MKTKKPRIISIFPPMLDKEIDFHPLPLPKRRKTASEVKEFLTELFWMLAVFAGLIAVMILIVSAAVTGLAMAWLFIQWTMP
mgnify:FL=1